MKSLGFVMLLAACSFQASSSGSNPGGDDGPGSGSGSGSGDGSGSGTQTDGGTTPIDAARCFGTGLLKLCLSAAPTGNRTLSTSNFDTGTKSNCTETFPQNAGPELCVVAAENLTVSGTFTVTGSRPLVLIAAASVQIQDAGTIDVSSKINGGGRTGAGANTGLCSTLGHGTPDRGGGGGGAGGSFGTAGGKGGTGDTNTSDSPTGVAPGAAIGTTHTPTILVGGCSGSPGGGFSTTSTVTGGPGGDGGGAVFVIAGNAITVAGNIFASGAGGGADSSNNGVEQGGGGGGTGGMIGLDAPTITVTGRIAANGGGGAGGGSLAAGGGLGGDGSTTNWNGRATAGVGDKDRNGDGGDGSPGTSITATTNIDGSDSDGGAGGGAGGLGLVWTYGGTIAAGTMVSPAPVAH